MARTLMMAGPLLTGLVWSYWTTLADMQHRWAHDPQYSHGYLVPLFAAALMWNERARLNVDRLIPSWSGLCVLAAGVAQRLVGAYWYLEWLDGLSLLPVLGGIAWLAGGRHLVRWMSPAIAFLFFMVPLPYTLEVALSGPLRSLGTTASTYFMQFCGLPAVAEGHVIVVGDARIGVVEACSGLRMLMVFFALSAAVALISPRSRGRQLLILVSAVPIALIANVVRITITAIVHGTLGAETADFFFHDLAGWLMMPLALGLLWCELWYLSRLLSVEYEEPIVFGLSARPVGPVGTARVVASSPAEPGPPPATAQPESP